MASAALARVGEQGSIESLPSTRGYGNPSRSVRPRVVERPTSALPRAGERPAPYPTILIAAPNSDARRWLVNSLTDDNYLVLEADCDREVLRIATVHSRPIHVLLLDNHLIDEALMKRLQHIRPQAQIVILGQEADAGAPSTVAVLAKARQLLKPAQQMAARTS